MSERKVLPPMLSGGSLERGGAMLVHFRSIPDPSNMPRTPIRDSIDVRTLIRLGRSAARILQLRKERVQKLYVLGRPKLRTCPVLGDSVGLTWMISWPLRNASELRKLKGFAQSSLRYLHLQPVFDFLDVYRSVMIKELVGKL